MNRHGRNCSTMINKQVLSLLGLARRAQQIVTGEGMVLKAVRQRKVFLVFLASDAGNATSKEFQNKCRYYHVSLVQDFTAAQLSSAIGMPRKVIGVKQAGFANKMKKMIKNETI